METKTNDMETIVILMKDNRPKGILKVSEYDRFIGVRWWDRVVELSITKGEYNTLSMGNVYWIMRKYGV